MTDKIRGRKVRRTILVRDFLATGYTQATLARRVGLSKSLVSAMLSGERTQFDVDSIERVALALGHSLDRYVRGM